MKMNNIQHKMNGMWIPKICIDWLSGEGAEEVTTRQSSAKIDWLILERETKKIRQMGADIQAY